MKEKDVLSHALVDGTIHAGEDIIDAEPDTEELKTDDFDDFEDEFWDVDEDELFDEEIDFAENYITLLTKINRLASVSHATELLKDEDEETFGEMIAVLCGKTVAEITDPEVAGPLLEKTREAGVKVKLCGFSVEKNKVDTSKIPDDIEIVDNGIWYGMRKQQEGYWSLGL